MNHRDTFNECGKIETPDSVLNVSGSAADNAADTLGWENFRGENGEHTDEFINMWVLSVSSILSSLHCDFTAGEAKEVREWFAARGINY